MGGGTATYTSYINKGAVTAEISNKRFIGKSKNDILGHKAWGVISSNVIYLPSFDWELVQYIKNNILTSVSWDSIYITNFQSVNINFALYTFGDPASGASLYVFD